MNEGGSTQTITGGTGPVAESSVPEDIWDTLEDMKMADRITSRANPRFKDLYAGMVKMAPAMTGQAGCSG